MPLNANPSYTVSLRLQIPATQTGASAIVAKITATGALVTGMDIAEALADHLVLDLTCDTRNLHHRQEVVSILRKMPGVVVESVGDATFMAHVGGKLSVEPKARIRNRDDLSRVYTPGVARVCETIHKDRRRARKLTMKKNTVAVVTDGTAVLGLGDIGPEAALPVMEGKAVLFKQFGGVDAWPVALDTKDTEQIIAIVKALAPAYGGVNLEDISAPRCFEIERRLRAELDIPVFHDDQHGTAIVVLAALVNALKVVNKRIEDVKIVVSGVGAAGTAIIRLLLAQGAQHVVGFGRAGAIHKQAVRPDWSEDRRWLADHTNPEGFAGGLVEGLDGADVFIGVSHGGILQPADLKKMAPEAIVFALANPTPEVDPIGAADHAAIVATGRSDFPNQINNVLAFPGLFRGLLDAGVSKITDRLLQVAATAIAEVITDEERSPAYIIPNVFDERVAVAVSKAVRREATQPGG